MCGTTDAADVLVSRGARPVDPVTVFEVQAGTRTFIVSSAADLDRILDELTAATTTPTLIGLRASETVLHIGVGDPSASVALLLDAQGRPFFAESPSPDRPEPGMASFDHNGLTRQFHRRARIAPMEARHAAVDFFIRDGARPPRLRWIPEGRPTLGDL